MDLNIETKLSGQITDKLVIVNEQSDQFLKKLLCFIGRKVKHTKVKLIKVNPFTPRSDHFINLC